MKREQLKEIKSKLINDYKYNIRYVGYIIHSIYIDYSFIKIEFYNDFKIHIPTDNINKMKKEDDILDYIVSVINSEWLKEIKI